MAPAGAFPDAVQVSTNIETDSKWEEPIKENHDQKEDEKMQSINTVEEALQHYGQRFGKQLEEEFMGFNRKAFPWTTTNDANVKEMTGMKAQSELEKDLGLEQGSLSQEQRLNFVKPAPAASTSGVEEDSDGEELRLCRMCNLPLGDVAYNPKRWCSGIRDSMHGECMALHMAQQEKEKEDLRVQKEKLAKKQQHEEYGIGWKVDHIPRNTEAASKLAMRDVPQGMVCLILDEDSRSIRVASTVEPAASLNLEYLSTAMRVLRLEGHEPVFSLDPVDPTDKNSMQEKVFVPDWLAGTSVGEVLFQSDYHLKELSMGEHDQPVVGMKSCFHYSEQEGPSEWTAREWFMVRKAEIHITDASMLIPYVRMGVEAREQVVNGNSLEDLPITRPDHPMVRYAEAFTQNFDLIAERKSVVYHLRELAKTSAIAKFLQEAQVDLDDHWFYLAEERDITCSLEVPQLWNKSMSASMEISDGNINTRGRQHGVYGGVNFGMDKFNLSKGTLRPSASLSMAGVPGRAVGLSRLAGRLTATPLAVSAGQPGAPAATLSAGALAPLGRPGLQPMGSFATSLLTRARDAGVKAPGARPFTISAAEPSAALSLATTPAARVPQIGIPSIGAGRLPGAPSTLGVAAFVGRAPRPPTVLPTERAAFDLARADLTPLQMRAMLAPPPAALSAAALAGQPTIAAPPISAAVMAPRVTSMAGVPRLQAALAAAALAPKLDVPGAPPLQGVDLRLDSFDLSSAKRVSLEAQEGSWGNEARSLDECVAVGTAFWSGLQEDSKLFKEDDRALLLKIFNDEMSDRRLEGDRFAPPDATYDYVQKLRVLVKEEDVVRQKRKQQFFSKTFVMTNPGTLYPASWSSGFEASKGSAPVREAVERPQAALHVRPEYKGQTAIILLEVMKTSSPVFDKTTEEGMQFRIYQMGTLEVRTTQMVGQEEEVGVVFSIRSPTTKGGRKGERVHEQEKVVKASEYVEAAFACKDETSASARPCRYYVVFETENGHKIVTERLSNGRVLWDEDPEDVEDRNSLAKVTRVKPASAGLTVRDMKAYHTSITKGSSKSEVSPSVCKRFARNLFARAVATPGSQATVMPGAARSARLAVEARKAGRPPAWSDITMASN